MFDIICYVVLFVIVLACLIAAFPRLLLGALGLISCAGLIVFGVSVIASATPLDVVAFTIIGCTVYLGNIILNQQQSH
jgi:hypothetical protein